MFKNQIHKNQKEVKIQMPINQNRRKEMCLIHTMEYYLAIKSNEVNLENIEARKRSPVAKAT